MVTVYALNLQNILDPKDYPELLELIPSIRREKTMRYKTPEARRQSLGAGILLQEVMKRYDIKESDIYFGENGKPEAKNIYFNLSHSNEVVICAVGECAVGCDIEKIKKEPKKVAQKCLSQSELSYLESLSNEEREATFFRFWTMKESFVKMTGEGMKVDFNRLEFDLWNEKIQVKTDGMIQPCFIKEYKIPAFKVTVCAKESEFAEEIIDFTSDFLYNTLVW